MKRREKVVECIMESVETVNAGGNFVVKDMLVAEVCMKFFCGERLIKEILKHLDIIKRIKMIENEVWTPSNFEAHLILESKAAAQPELNPEEHGS